MGMTEHAVQHAGNKGIACPNGTVFPQTKQKTWLAR
jgi:hypothetical protein